MKSCCPLTKDRPAASLLLLILRIWEKVKMKIAQLNNHSRHIIPDASTPSFPGFWRIFWVPKVLAPKKGEISSAKNRLHLSENTSNHGKKQCLFPWNPFKPWDTATTWSFHTKLDGTSWIDWWVDFIWCYVGLVSVVINQMLEHVCTCSHYAGRSLPHVYILYKIYIWLMYIEMLLKSQGQERKVVQNSMKFRDPCLFGFRVNDGALDKQRKGGGWKKRSPKSWRTKLRFGSFFWRRMIFCWILL